MLLKRFRITRYRLACFVLVAIVLASLVYCISYFISWSHIDDEVENTEDVEHQDLMTITANGVDFNMVLVEGGEYEATVNPFAVDSVVQKRKVDVESFAIGQIEVPQVLWVAVMGFNPSFFRGNNLPVESVSAKEAQAFVARLSRLTGYHFRIPTDVEWEYAALGGVKSQGYLYAGSDLIDRSAWYHSNSGDSPHPVGCGLCNELGLYDMCGNVAEVCCRQVMCAAGINNEDPKYVVRGGHVSATAEACQIRYCVITEPDVADYTMGFRLVMPASEFRSTVGQNISTPKQ